MKHRTDRTDRSTRAFTLVELVIVVALIGIAASIGGIYLSGIMSSAAKRQAEKQLAADLWLARAANVQAGLVTRIYPVSSGTGTSVAFDSMEDVGAPCTMGVTPVVTSPLKEYDGIDVGIATGESVLCFTADGQPLVDNATLIPEAVTVVVSDVSAPTTTWEIVLTLNGGIEGPNGENLTEGLMNMGLHPHDVLNSNPPMIPLCADGCS